MTRVAVSALLALGALVALGRAGSARAQQPDTLVLTLDRANAIARRNNPAYRSAVRQLELNGPETRAAWTSGVFPSLRIDLLETIYSGNLQKRATDPFGNPVANPDAEYVYFSNTRQGIGLYWQLRGPSAWNRLERIGVENRGRELNEELAGEGLRRDVVLSFFDALEQEKLLAAQQDLAAAIHLDLAAAQHLFELALRSRVDVLQAELMIEQQDLAVRRQRGLRDQARLTLATLLGRTDLPPVRPAALPPALFDPAELDGDALVARATDRSSSVRRAEDALRVADLGVRDSRAAYWPTLNASLSLGRLVQAPSTEGLFKLGGFGDEVYASFSLGISLPFFNDIFGNQLAVSRAEVARGHRRNELSQARLEAERATRSALLLLRDRWDELRIAERSLAIASEALELAREEYRLGGCTFEQLQRSVSEETNVRRQLIQARYGFVDAVVELEAVVGGPVR